MGKSLLLIGQEGMGKTTLSAVFSRSLIHSTERPLVLTYFYGASSQSRNVRATLSRFCHLLRCRIDVECQKSTESQESENIPNSKEISVMNAQELQTVYSVLVRRAAQLCPVWIVIDGIDQLLQIDPIAWALIPPEVASKDQVPRISVLATLTTDSDQSKVVSRKSAEKLNKPEMLSKSIELLQPEGFIGVAANVVALLKQRQACGSFYWLGGIELPERGAIILSLLLLLLFSSIFFYTKL